MNAKHLKKCAVLCLAALALLSLCVDKKDGNTIVSTTTTTMPSCLGEGQGGGGGPLPVGTTVLPCCDELKKIPRDMQPDEKGICQQAADGGYVCTRCGDGNCGVGENECSCPQDCNNTVACSSSLRADLCAKAGGKWGIVPRLGPLCSCPFTEEQIAACDKACQDAGSTGSNAVIGGLCEGFVIGTPMCCCKDRVTNSTCGNGECEASETAANCPQDCDTR